MSTSTTRSDTRAASGAMEVTSMVFRRPLRSRDPSSRILSNDVKLWRRLELLFWLFLRASRRAIPAGVRSVLRADCRETRLRTSSWDSG
jgi:hypothetical protein